MLINSPIIGGRPRHEARCQQLINILRIYLEEISRLPGDRWFLAAHLVSYVSCGCTLTHSIRVVQLHKANSERSLCWYIFVSCTNNSSRWNVWAVITGNSLARTRHVLLIGWSCSRSSSSKSCTRLSAAEVGGCTTHSYGISANCRADL